jgi:hypothetical protein
MAIDHRVRIVIFPKNYSTFHCGQGLSHFYRRGMPKEWRAMMTGKETLAAGFGVFERRVSVSTDTRLNAHSYGIAQSKKEKGTR